MYKCDECGGYMIVTSIETSHMNLYCPRCKRKDTYPKKIRLIQTGKTIYINNLENLTLK